ncbi:S-Ena type endospore appendage [Sporosarcina sp.]|uniref:S-Ena type endospore appendage n=1 Tax=Sporosarcina sp. TaxID=49982 RepID=UPI002610B1CF|nr:S-Ena type endospore appendage [Sporosarcina sp.]
MIQSRRGHQGKCGELFSKNTLVHVTMQNGVLRAAGKMSNGNCFTTCYFSVQHINYETGCVVLQLIRPIFRKRLLLIRTNKTLMITLDCVCAVQKLARPVLDWVELKDTVRNAACGNICREWSSEQPVIYRNYSCTSSIAFFVFSYWKGTKEKIQLRISSRSQEDVFLTVARGETVSIAIKDIVLVEITTPSARVTGRYTISLHQLYTNRIQDCFPKRPKYFREMVLITETVHLCNASGKVFHNFTDQLLYATVTITNKNDIKAVVKMDGESFFIPSNNARSITVSSLDCLETICGCPVDITITFHTIA